MRLSATETGEGPLVILLHGMGQSAATWDDVAANLAVAYHVVSVDLLGHGQSPTPPDPLAYRRAECLEDIDETIATFRQTNEPPVLIGHGFGGYLALSYELERPGAIRGLALIGAATGFDDLVAQVMWNQSTLDNADELGIEPVACTLGVIADSMVIDRLGEVDVPTLVLVGEHDHAFAGAAQLIDQRVADSTLGVIAEAKHNAHLTQPDKVSQQLHPFLQRLHP